jgi:hypothetical protein
MKTIIKRMKKELMKNSYCMAFLNLTWEKTILRSKSMTVLNKMISIIDCLKTTSSSQILTIKT